MLSVCREIGCRPIRSSGHNLLVPLSPVAIAAVRAKALWLVYDAGGIRAAGRKLREVAMRLDAARPTSLWRAASLPTCLDTP